MKYKRALILTLICAGALLCLHLLALKYYLYWLIPWFDIVLHILGGFVIGMGVFAIVPLKKSSVWFTPLFCVLLMSIFWEIFEFKIGLTFAGDNLLVDTLGDIAFSLVGAFSSIGVYLRNISNE